MFDPVRTLDDPSRALALVAAAFAVLASGRLQALAWRLRAQESKSRLASNLRDFVNLAAVAILSGAFLLAGMPLALSFLAAGTVVIVEETLRHAQGHESPLPVMLGLLLAMPAAFYPQAVADAATAAARLVGV